MNEDDNPKERITMLTQRLALALALAIEASAEQKRSLPTSLGKAHG